MTIRQRPASRVPLVLSSFALTTSLLACGGPMDLEETNEEIIGGVTNTGDPAVVALLAAAGGGERLCTATVISPTVLLTAAHCVVNPATFTVIRDNQLTRNSVRLPVKRIAFSPQYNGNNIGAGHDVAVAVLQSPIDVAPMRVNRTSLAAASKGQPSRLVGYGLSNAQQQTGAGLKRQVTTILNDYNATLVQIGEPTKDTCSGDSGGPAFIGPAGNEVIVGITSFGSPACNGDGLYTRVDAELAFIDQQLALEGVTAPPPDETPVTPPTTEDPDKTEVPTTPDETPTTPTTPQQPTEPTTPPQTSRPPQTNTTPPTDPEDAQDQTRDGFSGELVSGSCTCLGTPRSAPAAGLALFAFGLVALVRPRRRD